MNRYPTREEVKALLFAFKLGMVAEFRPLAFVGDTRTRSDAERENDETIVMQGDSIDFQDEKAAALFARVLENAFPGYGTELQGDLVLFTTREPAGSGTAAQ